MARRKQEIQLQVELETQEDWEGALSKEGLLVVDVYQEWAGPCAGMVGTFRKIKNELGDDLLRFAVAKADTIDSLERYRGKCEPCFLIYAGGTLVFHLAGARVPVIAKAIPEQLAHEHKVLSGDAERKVICDPMFEEQPEKEDIDEDEDDRDEMEVEKEVTVCLIKPDAVEAGKVEEITQQLIDHGLEILKHEERQLTEEEAKSFYAAHEEAEYFKDLVTFMCSGPSHVLVLSEDTSGENTISKFRDLLGPKMVEEAKEQAPDSLRAKYGTTSMTNAVHGSDDKDNAMKELAFFFPDYAIPTRKIKHKKPKIQRTLALIRPDALKEHKEDIIRKIREAGFQIAFQKEVQLTKEQAEEFYKEHNEEEYYEELTKRMSNSPLLALALAREDAVDGWRDMLGPKEVPKAKEEAPESLRAQFSVEEDLINPLHGSDSVNKAEEEISYFFPMQQTVAVVKPDAYQTKDEIIKRIHEAGFRIAARKETEITKDIAEQLYEDHKDKEYFDTLTNHMTEGQSLFLVLSREDAVDGWRSLMGPTDPTVAKEAAPETIRAKLGEDVQKNAVHGSSNADHATKEMKLVFGEMEFNEDGTVKGAEPELDVAAVERDETANEDDTDAKDGVSMEQEDADQEPEPEEVDVKTGDGEPENAESTHEGEGEAKGEAEVDVEKTEPTTGEATAEGGEAVAATDAEPAPAEGETSADKAESSEPSAEKSEEAPAAAAETPAEAPAEETAEEADTAKVDESAPEVEVAAQPAAVPADSTDTPAADVAAESADTPAEQTGAESTEPPAVETPEESKTEEDKSAEPAAETAGDTPVETAGDSPVETAGDTPAETAETPAEKSEDPAASEEKTDEEEGAK